jgi:hypothetical protein
MPLLVVYNPVSGTSSGKEITEHWVVPLLAQHGIIPDQIVGTQQAGHAGEIVIEFLSQIADGAEATLILVSGDGTLHEIANTLYEKSRHFRNPLMVKLALVPGGTANALHSSLFPPSESSTMLSALHAYLSPSRSMQRLSLAQTILHPSNSKPTEEVVSIISAVVTSTSLHACILHDAEALRASVPGLDRFKIAAAQNATRWFNARLLLRPPLEGGKHGQPDQVLQYDPALERFVSVQGSSTHRTFELAKPFSYMLTTVNVDRLEPAFRITPLQRSLPPSPPTTMDVIVIRPHQDSTISGDSDAEREAFKDKVWSVMSGAYQDGAHITNIYDAEGNIVSGVAGKPVVEYFRVGEWEWIPVRCLTSMTDVELIEEQDEADERAHLVCADGTVLTIPTGGRATSRVLSDEDLGFSMFVYS